MSFADTLQEMLVILFAIGVGFFANRLGYLGGEVDSKLSKVILNLTMPAMIVAAVITGDALPELSELVSVLLISAVFYGLAFGAAAVLPWFLGGTPAQKGVWRYALSFPNVGFIGYPIAVALFGPGALFYAVVLALPMNIFSYSMGPLMLAGRAKFHWKQLFSPCVVASLLALVLALLRIRPPQIVGETLSFVGDATVPLSLLVIGSLLAGLSAGNTLKSPRLWIMTALRLLILPALLSPLLRVLGFTGLAANIAVIQMAMPVAINGSMLSMEYGGDTESMAQLTFLTTLASIVTIPVVAALFL